MTNIDVLVVGAGPTGLTLGCCLARHGVDVRLVEQLHEPPSPDRGSRGTAYQVRTLEVFDDLGIVDEALADAWTDLPVRIYRSGELVADMSLVAKDMRPTPEVPYPTMARPLQTWRVEQLLWNRLEDFGLKVDVGRELVDLEVGSDGVTAWLRSSAAREEGWGRSASAKGEAPPSPIDRGDCEEVRARYVVGCDGGRSAVRGLSGLHYETRRDLGFAGMIADVEVDGIEPTYMRMWFGPDGREVVLSPQPTTRNFQFIAQMDADDEGQFPEPSLELAQRIFDQRAGIQGVRFRAIKWKSFFKVRESIADHYRAGRAFIAGDAAHLHSPAGGLGANSGIQDAYNLAWKLAYVMHGIAPDTLLDTYEAERRPVAEEVLQASGDQHKNIFDRLPSSPIAADPLRETQDRSLAEWMSQLGVAYPDSRLSGGSRAPQRPTLGDRAPDGRLIAAHTGQRLRLFDVFRGGHLTLLLFGTEHRLTAIGTGVRKRYGDVVRPVILKGVDDIVEGWDSLTYIDPHGRARAAYQADDRPIVLVRPDGYIAFHGDMDDEASLMDHLDTILLPVRNCRAQP